MKLNALTDARHSDKEIERRLAEIDDDIRIGLMDSSVAVPARACPCETEIPFGQYLQSPFVDACVSLMRSFFDTEGWQNGMEVGLPIFL